MNILSQAVENKNDQDDSQMVGYVVSYQAIKLITVPAGIVQGDVYLIVHSVDLRVLFSLHALSVK